MRLRDLYKEFIRLHMSKKDRLVSAIVPDKGLYGEDKENAMKYDWYTDGFSIWSVPKKENPFKVEQKENGTPITIVADWIYRDNTTEVIKRTADPEIGSKIIKLVDRDGDFMYLDSKKLKFFDNNAELRIIKAREANNGYYTTCQVVEDDEVRGIILGVRVDEKNRF